MRNLLFILLACTICYPLVTASQSQQRGLKVVALDPLTKEKIQLYQDSRALLIGINKYQNVEQLNYAVADAESMRSLLAQKFNFKSDHIITLTDTNATRNKIMDAFATLLEGSSDDRIIVFYAGHGTQVDLPGGGEMGYLIPVDGKTKTQGELFTTCISMDEIKRIANQIPAKHVLFLVDACYGGLAAITSRSLSSETQLYLQKISKARARQIITAGGRGEKSIEKAEWGHSAFTRATLEGLSKELADLDGNKLITASELAAYLKPKVTVSSESRQTPQFKSFTDDEGDFVFVLSTKFELQIYSIPSGASVRIDGNEIGTTPLTTQMDFGEYDVEVNSSGYIPHKEKIDLKKDMNITAQLIERLYEVAITSNPEGAQVFLNGVPQQGTTTLVTKVKPGLYSVELEKQGYLRWTKQVDINANKTITAELKEIGVEEKLPIAEKKKEEEKPTIPKIEQPSSNILWILGGGAVLGVGAYFLFVKTPVIVDGEPTLTDQHPTLPGTIRR